MYQDGSYPYTSFRTRKNLTFFCRVPRIELKPLNFGAIVLNYKKNLSVTPDEAGRMAQLTQGRWV